jgi:hypothetical protein
MGKCGYCGNAEETAPSSLFGRRLCYACWEEKVKCPECGSVPLIRGGDGVLCDCGNIYSVSENADNGMWSAYVEGL